MFRALPQRQFLLKIFVNKANLTKAQFKMLEKKLRSGPQLQVTLVLVIKVVMNASTVLVSEKNLSSRSVYSISQHNKRLVDHVVKSLECPSLLMCSQLCLRHSWCTSTNFKQSDKRTCELNMQEDIPGYKELIHEQGVTFSIFLRVSLIQLTRLK